MSYLDYLKLYTKNKSNCGRFTKRGRKDNHWLNSIKVNDKLDIFDDNTRWRGDNCWHIGTVLKIERIVAAKSIKIHIHYDGWPANIDEWISVNIDNIYSTTTPLSMKLKPLHTFTPKHNYLLDTTSKECRWGKTLSSWKKCDICHSKCCTKCFISKDHETEKYLCKHCMESADRNDIFDAIYTDIANQYAIDINIIYLLTDYTMGYIVKCSNRSKKYQCPNPIFFPSRFALQISATTLFKPNGQVYQPHGNIYHYISSIPSADTDNIFGENRRIFCEHCTQNRLAKCSHFRCKLKDLAHPDGAGTLCFNHEHSLKQCTICEFAYDLSENVSICDCCDTHHCRDCHAETCYVCNSCNYGKYGCVPKKCVECHEFICSKIQIKCTGCDGIICPDCKAFYGWKGGKSVRKCGGCKGNKKDQLHNNDYPVLPPSSQQSGCDLKSYKQNMTMMDGIDDIYGICDKYTKYKMSKKKQKRKVWNKTTYHRKRFDKIISIKQKKKFNKRYGLLLQY